MIIRLSHRQWLALSPRISPDLVEAMRENRTAVAGTHDYLLPAIGWRRVLDQLLAVAYGPMGGKLPNTSMSLYTAIAKISDKVGLLEAHPGLTPGRGVVGVSSDIIPAWLGPDRTFSPYPVEGWAFCVLYPQHEVRGHDIQLTYWAPFKPGDRLVEQEGFHERLAGGLQG